MAKSTFERLNRTVGVASSEFWIGVCEGRIEESGVDLDWEPGAPGFSLFARESGVPSVLGFKLTHA